MANTFITDRKYTITTSDNGNTLILGDGDVEYVSTWVIHLVKSSYDGSVTVKARARGKAAADDSVAFVPINYAAHYLNGAVTSPVPVSTAITDTSLILVPASGMSIALAPSGATTGTLTIYAHPLQGAAV